MLIMLLLLYSLFTFYILLFKNFLIDLYDVQLHRKMENLNSILYYFIHSIIILFFLPIICDSFLNSPFNYFNYLI